MATVLTALETTDCPPHHWILNDEGMGKCRKCKKKQDFAHKDNQSLQYQRSSANSGRAARKENGNKKA